MEQPKKLKIVTTTIRDFLATPKEFLSKLLEENLGKIEIKLNSKSLYLLSKDMFEIFVRLEVRKKEIVFEEKYRKLKERFTKATETVDVAKLTKAQQALIQLEERFHLFNGLTHGELLTVVEKIQILRMKKGEKVFSMYNTSKEMFFVVGGGVDILINDSAVASLPKGSFFGEMAYIANQPRSATAVIKTPVCIILSFKIKESSNPNQSEAYMKLYRNINHMLVFKIEEMNKKIYK